MTSKVTADVRTYRRFPHSGRIVAAVTFVDEPGQLLRESERDELRRLRTEVRELRLEREILKKATAFFAKHTK